MSRDVNVEKKLRRRALILGLSKSFLSLLIFGKLFYLQILQKSKYGKLSDINRLKVKIYIQRGEQSLIFMVNLLHPIKPIIN